MKHQKDYYQILGVNATATLEEIKSAYRRLVLLNHPDRNSSAQANARMQEINEAYDVLGDQSKRTKYDFEYHNFTIAAQTKASSYAETANLREFSDQENPIQKFYFIVVAVCVVIGVSLCSAFLMFAGLIPLPSFLSPRIVLLFGPLAFVGLLIWRAFRSREKEHQCPKCKKLWATEKLDDRLLGRFEKIESVNSRPSTIRFSTREKYQIHYQCKYCLYEWLFIKIRKA